MSIFGNWICLYYHKYSSYAAGFHRKSWTIAELAQAQPKFVSNLPVICIRLFTRDLLFFSSVGVSRSHQTISTCLPTALSHIPTDHHRDMCMSLQQNWHFTSVQVYVYFHFSLQMWGYRINWSVMWRWRQMPVQGQLWWEPLWEMQRGLLQLPHLWR